MTEPITDRELLRQYAERGSESAFRSLVERHANLVYATALRGLNDDGAAAEVSQNVFTLLARKGPWLCGETTIAPWLHKATLLEVRKWWRGELRRQRREQTAVELGTLMKTDDPLLKALAGELDDGLLELRDAERTALILRYFEGLSHREIGLMVGAREDAVRMRINKALERLTEYFRRRGHAVPAAAVVASALSASIKAAPMGFAGVAAGKALAISGSVGTTSLIKPLVAKIAGLSKTKTAAVCLGLAVMPIVWEWHVSRAGHRLATTTEVNLAASQNEQSKVSAELQRLQAESTRLDAAIAGALQNKDRYEAAAAKLEALRARVRSLLTDDHYRWPDDLPYVRVAKSEVRSLDLLHKPGNFDMDGNLNHNTQEMLGITAEEKGLTEQALAGYWHGVMDMMNQNAYQTNVVTDASGQMTDTVIVPPLGDPLKTLAKNTATQISGVLGGDREQMLFGDWDQGGIQIFSPGNLWLIGDQAQEFTVWVKPDTSSGTPSYGYGWHVGGSGISSGGNSTDFDLIPAGIYTKFFAPWISQLSVTPSAVHPLGGSNE